MYEELKQKAMSGVKWNSLATAAATLTRLATLAVLTRLLRVSDIGLMAMIMTVISLAEAFSDAGLGHALIQRQNVPRNHLSSLFWCNVFCGTILFVMILGVSPLAAVFFKKPILCGYLRYAAFAFLITSGGQTFTTLLQKKLRFKALAVIELVGTIGYSVCAILLAWRGAGVMSMIIGHIVRSALAVVILWAIFRREWWPRFHFNIQEIKGYLGFGAFETGTRLAEYFTYNIDRIVIGRFLGDQAVGYYWLAYQLMVFPLTKINPIVTRIAFPAFSLLQHDNNAIRRGYGKMIGYLATIVFPTVAGMFVLAPEFILRVNGPEWAASIVLFRILSPLALSQALGNTTGGVMLGKGRAGLCFGLRIFGTILVVIGVGAGTVFGVNGAAVGILAAQLILFVVVLTITMRLIEMRFSEYFNTLRPALISTVMMTAIIIVVKNAIPPVHLSERLMVTIGAGVISYGIIFYFRQRQTWLELKTMLIKT